MNASTINFTEKDITTVYDALRACSARDVAGALLASGLPGEGARQALASRRVGAMLRLAEQVGPNLEATTRIFLPWKPSHVASLAHMAWPDALGTRIALPQGAGARTRASLLANVLLAMAHV